MKPFLKNAILRENRRKSTKVKIIFSDIDGTLINDALKVTPRTRQPLRHAVDTGILFVPVSARMPEAIKPILKVFYLMSPWFPIMVPSSKMNKGK